MMLGYIKNVQSQPNVKTDDSILKMPFRLSEHDNSNQTSVLKEERNEKNLQTNGNIEQIKENEEYDIYRAPLNISAIPIRKTSQAVDLNLIQGNPAMNNFNKKYLADIPNKFLLSPADIQKSVFLIKSTLQYPKITRFDDEFDRSNNSNRTSRLEEEKWTYSTTLHISNTSKYFDSYNVVFSIDKGENEKVVYNISCEKNDPETKIQSSKSCNLPVDLGPLGTFDDDYFRDLLKDVDLQTYLSSVHSINSLRKYEILINQVFMKGLELRINSETGKTLDLVFKKSNPGLLQFKIVIKEVEYTVKVVHNYFYIFRVMFFTKKNLLDNLVGFQSPVGGLKSNGPNSSKYESEQEKMQFFYDLWIDEEDFDDNFQILENNPIGEFYEEVLTKDAINLDKMKQKNNLVYFKSLRKKINFEELIKNNLSVFKSLVKKKKTDLSYIVAEYNYCISRYKSSTSSDFSLIRENQFNSELEFYMFQGEFNTPKDENGENNGKQSQNPSQEELGATTDATKIFPFSKFEHMFGIPINILSQHDKLYFLLNVFLTFLNMREDHIESGGDEFAENKKNFEKSIFVGEVNLDIYEQFFRRIFPGVYYKNPFTFSLVTLSGYFPVGVKVKKISKKFEKFIFLGFSLQCAQVQI